MSNVENSPSGDDEMEYAYMHVGEEQKASRTCVRCALHFLLQLCVVTESLNKIGTEPSDDEIQTDNHKSRNTLCQSLKKRRLENGEVTPAKRIILPCMCVCVYVCMYVWCMLRIVCCSAI